MDPSNSSNQEASGNSHDIPIDPSLLQMQANPAQSLPSETGDVPVSQVTGQPVVPTRNVQPLTLPGPAFPSTSAQLHLQLERTGFIQPRLPPAAIPDRQPCLQCHQHGLNCSFLTEDDPNKLVYKCADCHLNNRECRTKPGQLPLPARPLPRPAGLLPFQNYTARAGGNMYGFRGTAFPAGNVGYTAPPSGNSFLLEQAGGLSSTSSPPPPPSPPASFIYPSPPAPAADPPSPLQPNKRKYANDGAQRPAKKPAKNPRCYMCKKNDYGCQRLVPGDYSSGCIKCQTYGLVCWDDHNERVLPTALEWAGFSTLAASLYFKFCKRCQDDGWGCDRSRPCFQCRQAGVECEEQKVTRLRTPQNAFLNATAPGQDSELYCMSLGYGPWGVGTPRPPDRPDLPGPLNVLIKFKAKGKVPPQPQPRPEITNHLLQNGGTFIYPPRPADPNDPALWQLRGRGYTNRTHTAMAYGWNATGGGRAESELVALPQLQQQPAPRPAQAGLYPAPVVQAQQPDPQAPQSYPQHNPQGQARTRAPRGFGEQDLELFNRLGLW